MFYNFLYVFPNLFTEKQISSFKEFINDLNSSLEKKETINKLLKSQLHDVRNNKNIQLELIYSTNGNKNIDNHRKNESNSMIEQSKFRNFAGRMNNPNDNAISYRNFNKLLNSFDSKKISLNEISSDNIKEVTDNGCNKKKCNLSLGNEQNEKLKTTNTQTDDYLEQEHFSKYCPSKVICKYHCSCCNDENKKMEIVKNHTKGTEADEDLSSKLSCILFDN